MLTHADPCWPMLASTVPLWYGRQHLAGETTPSLEARWQKSGKQCNATCDPSRATATYTCLAGESLGTCTQHRVAPHHYGKVASASVMRCATATYTGLAGESLGTCTQHRVALLREGGKRKCNAMCDGNLHRPCGGEFGHVHAAPGSTPSSREGGKRKCNATCNGNLHRPCGREPGHVHAAPGEDPLFGPVGTSSVI